MWKRFSATALDIDCQFMDIESDEGYLINPGSVGQSRDGDSRAAYVLYNAEEGVVSYCRMGTTWRAPNETFANGVCRRSWPSG